ncbi:MAG: hypothetical protein ACOCXA_01065 [Planctomycetota bacterium]
MSLRQDILELLRAENYPINEVITDALGDFIQIVEDEAESMERDLVDEDEVEDLDESDLA